MITDSRDIGDCFDIFGQLAPYLLSVHLVKEHPFTWISLRITIGLHGKMEDNLPTLLMSLLSKGFGIRGKRKDRESERNIPTEDFLSKVVFSSKVVNHDRNLGPTSSLERWGFCVDEVELMGDVILNPYFQLERI
jgi:hypothetical protein